MKKIFTGMGQFTPHRPWGEERKQAARKRSLKQATERAARAMAVYKLREAEFQREWGVIKIKPS